MKSILLTVGICLAISPLTAQSSPALPPVMPFGVIKGFVREAYSDLPLHYANVVVMGTTRGAMTEKDGSYSILFLAPGTYAVKAMMMGFDSVTRYRIVVGMGVETELAFSLKVRRPPMMLREGADVGASASK